MIRRFLPALVPVCLVLAVARPAAAGSYPVFGPEDFQQPGGKPLESSRTFAAPVPGAGYRLVIENGGGAGRFSRAGNVRVTLNGTVVVRDNELDPSLDRIERPVALAARNVLEVRLAGRPATTAGIRLGIFGTDDEPPTIVAAVTPPANAAGWHAVPPTVSFTCSDKLSGIATCPAPVRVETEGAQQVVAGTAVDKAGNRSTVQARVSFDRTPPAVAFTSPAGGSETYDSASPVAGTATDSSGALALQVQGNAVVPEADGRFSGSVSLQGGDNLIQAMARDPAGNTATATVRIVRLLPPEVAIAAPADQSLTASSSIEVRGMVGGGAVAVTVAGLDVPVVNRSFATQVPLAEGDNPILAVARDPRGRTATVTVLVVRDTVPPVVELLAPADGLETNAPAVVVRGRASDDRRLAAVDVAGTPVEPGPDGALAQEIPLADGENAWTVTVLDAAGNQAAATLRLVRVALPEVAIEEPAAQSLTAAPTVAVRGRISPGTVAVEVNGLPATVEGGTFLADPVPLFEGTNTLTALARDARGRTVTATVQVIRDSTAPRLSIHAPAEGLRTGAAAVTVTGMVNDLIVGSFDRAEARVEVNGVAAVVDNRSFVAPNVPLAPGENHLTAQATDLAGNTGTAAITVWRETMAGGPSLQAVAGDLQEGESAAELPLPLEVELRDAAGQPVAGRPVLFRVAENNGGLRLAATAEPAPAVLATTDAAGRAQARWTLGTRSGPGRNRVEATAEGVEGAAAFTASGRPGAGAALHLDAGSRQSGLVGHPLPRPFAAVVTDRGHNRLEGVSVTFRVVAGGGGFGGRDTFTVATDAYGRALATLTLGPAPGIEDQIVEADFPGNPGARAVFTASGYLAGDPAETRVTGLVLDSAGEPLPGVTASLAETELSTRTDEQGSFTLKPAPVGKVRLIVDGATAERPGTWPSLEYELVTVPGQENKVGLPIHLLPLDVGHGVFVDEVRGGTLTVPDLPGFALEIAPGSATFPGGGRSGIVSVTLVHADQVPMVPNFGQQPRLVVTIQPSGVRFDPPAALTIPNVEGLAPGEVTEMYSFDHDLGMFVSIGTGTVTADGSLVRSDPGVGVVEGAGTARAARRRRGARSRCG